MDVQDIRQGLLRPGKSRAGLAERLGVDVSQISRLLNGKRHLKVHELPIIEDYLFGDLPNGSDRENGSWAQSSTPSHMDQATSPQNAEALNAISHLIDEADRYDVNVAETIVRALRQAIEDRRRPARNDHRDWL